jgi:predicted ATP-dependent protease
VWKVLKRTLKNRQIVIQPPDVALFLGQCSLKPDPIAINCKVILIGDWWMYQVLYHHEPEFRKIFKVLADFDTDMDLTEANLENYARFARKICDEEGLLPLDPSGVAKLVEYGVWRSGKRGKLTAVFSDLADIVRESHFWASQESKKAIGGEDIRQCQRAGIERHALPESKIQEHMRRETILIDTDGRRVGQGNALAVFDVGNYSFGAPVRITATVSTGRAGIVNIEREAKLSGRTHDKGVLILTGFLREKYAKDRPLNLYASLCFEQSSSGVEGDSATAAEIYVLLSALSGLPLEQSFAVTGSVNQKGDVQPVGGINAKIEGFFKACQIRGLSGRQGVIIPRANVPDLMLKEEVVEAVRDGMFHVWPIAAVDEGIEILAGVPAGTPDRRGAYPKGTVNRLVADRLRALSRGLGEERRSRKRRREREEKGEKTPKPARRSGKDRTGGAAGSKP